MVVSKKKKKGILCCGLIGSIVESFGVFTKGRFKYFILRQHKARVPSFVVKLLRTYINHAVLTDAQG